MTAIRGRRRPYPGPGPTDRGSEESQSLEAQARAPLALGISPKKRRQVGPRCVLGPPTAQREKTKRGNVAFVSEAGVTVAQLHALVRFYSSPDGQGVKWASSWPSTASSRPSFIAAIDEIRAAAPPA